MKEPLSGTHCRDKAIGIDGENIDTSHTTTLIKQQTSNATTFPLTYPNGRSFTTAAGHMGLRLQTIPDVDASWRKEPGAVHRSDL